MTRGGVPFLLQMAGSPGTGKSELAITLAAALLERGRAVVVINSDHVKAALLEHTPWEHAGPAAYAALPALASDVLVQGFGVILDSPCHYENVYRRGVAVAEERGVPYLMIECTAPSEVIRRRLAERKNRLPTQIVAIDEPPTASGGKRSTATRVAPGIWATHGPDDRLVLDTTTPRQHYLLEAMTYVRVSTGSDQKQPHAGREPFRRTTGTTSG